MAIIRKKRESHFTTISNVVFQRNQLSFQAMGMLGYLLSKPDNWQVSVAELQNVTKGSAKPTGREGVYNILKELKSSGFVVTQKQSSGEMDYYVFDEPVQEIEQDKKPNSAKPNQAKPNTAKPTQVNTDLKVNKDLNKKSTKKNGLDFTPLGFTDEQVEEFKQLRNNAKAPITQRVIASHGKQFDQTRQAGYTNDQILDLWADRAWKAFRYDWFINAMQNNGAFSHAENRQVNSQSTSSLAIEESKLSRDDKAILATLREHGEQACLRAGVSAEHVGRLRKFVGSSNSTGFMVEGDFEVLARAVDQGHSQSPAGLQRLPANAGPVRGDFGGEIF
ncbi:hypothetical protein [Vibrio sp. SCSIO 43136]|uniref:hypothetical protein n=1 Tax=Vibrio sp. SCSIO 43136 TaxID=2819101 RepID=UPI0020756FBD|nr:hypothetical protein [Vibrio sp. SCSIO 43136]USD64231.1 hypothetical protein J4N39_08920 [Vibrio sp. SCSIO 43136]